jgi:DNA-nicking Smr family endonuclease
LNNRISNKDKKDWHNFINSKEKLPNKDLKNNKKKIINTKSLDLHGYTLEDANKKIENFILENYQSGITKLLIVTGKGLHSDVEKNPYVSKNLSILKYSIPEFIRSNIELNKYINSFGEASIEDGGSGAFYIYLKKNK